MKDMNLSPIWKRVIAYIIDNIITVFLVMILPFSVSSILQSAPYIMLVMPIIYHTICAYSVWQASIGQRIMGIYVISLYYSRIGFLLSFDRILFQIAIPVFFACIIKIIDHLGLMNEYISMILSGIGQWLNILWYAVALRHPERATMHDKILGTRVVIGRL